MDDRDLESRVRAALERQAGSADVTAPVVERARREVAARRRTRWSAAAAAAAVVLVVGGIAVATSGEDRTADRPEVVDRSSEPPAPSGRWRTEYWADVAVDVPAEWGYGGAPYDGGTACYPEAMVGPDGRRLDDAGSLGHVGRPIAVTDVCALVPTAWEPGAPYVWLGADLATGTHEYDNGYVQETVEVNGSTVTVGTDDPTLRQRILDSARGGEMCLSELETGGDIRHDVAEGAGAEPVALRVCAYRSDEAGRTASLTYAAELGATALAAYEEALAAGEEPRDQCPTLDYVESEWVVLELVDRDGAPVRQDVVHLFGSCAGIAVGTDRLLQLETTRLTPEMVEPWAVGGVPAVVHGPTGGKGAMIDSFIGQQG